MVPPSPRYPSKKTLHILSYCSDKAHHEPPSHSNKNTGVNVTDEEDLDR